MLMLMLILWRVATATVGVLLWCVAAAAALRMLD